MRNRFEGFHILKERLEAAGLKGSNESNAASQVRPTEMRKANQSRHVRVSPPLAGAPAKDSPKHLGSALGQGFDGLARGRQESESVLERTV